MMARPIAIDLFCGVGGMSLGLEAAGFDVSCGVDIDPVHAAAHHFNFPYSQTICSNIQDFDGSKLAFVRPVDLISFGSPCQGFSVMGKQDSEDPRNQLSFEAARIIFDLQPKYFIMENVVAITKSPILKILVNHFNSNGYEVVKPRQVLNSADFGVPQTRKRFFLLGYRNDCPPPAYPQCQKPLTVIDAIADLANISPYLKEDLGIETTLLHNTPQSDHCHFREGAATTWGHLVTKHCPKVRDRFARTPPGKKDSVSRFPRLDPHGFAPTLRAGTPANRGSHTAPRPIHYEYPRCISIREAARLQGFPDWFQFSRCLWHGLRQIGNSVPPPVAQALGQEILKVLGEERQVFDRLQLCTMRNALLKFSPTEAANYWQVDPNINGKRERINV